MKTLTALLALVVLAGCGADGAPIRPVAGIGIGLGTNGVTVSPSVGISKGNVGASVSL